MRNYVNMVVVVVHKTSYGTKKEYRGKGANLGSNTCILIPKKSLERSFIVGMASKNQLYYILIGECCL